MKIYISRWSRYCKIFNGTTIYDFRDLPLQKCQNKCFGIWIAHVTGSYSYVYGPGILRRLLSSLPVLCLLSIAPIFVKFYIFYYT